MSTAPALSPELALAAACCRWPAGEARDRAVRACAEDVDARAFAEVAGRHRVAGLAVPALRSAGILLPDDVEVRLAGEARAIARGNLMFAAECGRVAQALASDKLAFLFLKGVTLAMLAYRSLAMKQAMDIDLLVDAADYERACGHLSRLGYVCRIPGDVPPIRLARWARRAKDTIWWHPERRILLELHQRLTANRRLLPDLGTRSPTQVVEVAPGLSLPTLATPELFAYLCVHGTFSGWHRLKWAADLNALIAGESDAVLELLYRRAVELGTGRSAACALLLCERLFDRRLPAGLAPRLRQDRHVRYLLNVALRALERGSHREITDQRFGTLPIHLSNLILAPGLGHVWAEVRQKLGRSLMEVLHKREPARPRTAA